MRSSIKAIKDVCPYADQQRPMWHWIHFLPLSGRDGIVEGEWNSWILQLKCWRITQVMHYRLVLISAPSDMMDGRIGVIRSKFPNNTVLQKQALASHSAKICVLFLWILWCAGFSTWIWRRNLLDELLNRWSWQRNIVDEEGADRR